MQPIQPVQPVEPIQLFGLVELIESFRSFDTIEMIQGGGDGEDGGQLAGAGNPGRRLGLWGNPWAIPARRRGLWRALSVAWALRLHSRCIPFAIEVYYIYFLVNRKFQVT